MKRILSKQPIESMVLVPNAIGRHGVPDRGMSLILCSILAMLACGCRPVSQRESANTRNADIKPARPITLPNVSNAPPAAENAAAPIARMASNALIAFDTTLSKELTIRAILASNSTSYEEVSNATAAIDSQTILDIVALQYDAPVGRYRTGPQEKAAMLLYRVVYERKTPPWASTFALTELADYYVYNSRTYPSESTWVLREVDALELTPQPGKAEFVNFCNLKFRLCRDTSNPTCALRNIARMQGYVKAGLLSGSEQAVEILPLMKAIALIRLRRVEEARIEVNQVYARMSELDPMTSANLEDGPEAFIRRQQTRDIYPELYDNE